MADQADATAALEAVRLGPATQKPHARAAVFLDRDGVLNDVRGAGDVSLPPRTRGDVVIARGAHEAVLRLRDADLALIVVTNQPDVARGTMTCDVAVDITRDIMLALALDDGYICIHDGPDDCPCRKPRPGMLLQAARDWDLALERCWLIGDRWVDIAAAVAAGAHACLLETRYSWDTSGGAEASPTLVPEFRGETLDSCVEFVLARA